MKIESRHCSDLKKLVSIHQACLVSNAASSHLGYKDTAILTTDDGDAQRFCAFIHDHIPRLLQVWPFGAQTLQQCHYQILTLTLRTVNTDPSHAKCLIRPTVLQG